jgi:hypothetical protein
LLPVKDDVFAWCFITVFEMVKATSV